MRITVTEAKYKKVQLSFVVNNVFSFSQAIEEIRKLGIIFKSPLNVETSPDLPLIAKNGNTQICQS